MQYVPRLGIRYRAVRVTHGSELFARRCFGVLWLLQILLLEYRDIGTGKLVSSEAESNIEAQLDSNAAYMHSYEPNQVACLRSF